MSSFMYSLTVFRLALSFYNAAIKQEKGKSDVKQKDSCLSALPVWPQEELWSGGGHLPSMKGVLGVMA